MPQVTFIQRVMPHYRIPFFVGLHEYLAARGIDLKLVYGQELPGTVPRTELLDQPWAEQIVNRYSMFFGAELVWQPCVHAVANANLVIVEQANRLLVNYLFQLMRSRKLLKVAYFGHGRNMQSLQPASWRERCKGFFLAKVDWWFAYTDLTGKLVAAGGFPRERITVVQNTIDTRDCKDQMAAISQDDLAALRADLGLVSENVAVFCGGMYVDKRLDFLLDACLALRKILPDFEMIFIGSGPEQSKVEQAVQKYCWIHYVGPRFSDRFPYFKLSKVLLMPGLVGLAIIDAFTMGVPLFTTSIPVHSPEIAYLENGSNGVMTANNLDAYVGAVAEYFGSTEQQQQLRSGCSVSACRYSMASMIAKFADGIQNCLEAPPLVKVKTI